MYRRGEEYDRLDQLVISIYIDYGLNSFPLDEKDVCRKMGLALVPYSEYTGEDRRILRKKSQYGFFVPESKENPPIKTTLDKPGHELNAPAPILVTFLGIVTSVRLLQPTKAVATLKMDNRINDFFINILNLWGVVFTILLYS